ncbi:hypothetical protein [Denitrobaculum tricleocarpae]|uniref:Uncharacterized protein n=1 Tax=Denitrobaculum tricleocarpae TaxID=2591009 RepID=A0A545U2W4_9PROT|nr:hypothetical protein [Denitrobaculum tricleocarpae]TQV83806.1 hypothetical protein FKG95_04295 [Denitrobaculum tricleocarpae]
MIEDKDRTTTESDTVGPAPSGLSDGNAKFNLKFASHLGLLSLDAVMSRHIGMEFDNSAAGIEGERKVIEAKRVIDPTARQSRSDNLSPIDR